MCGGCGVWGVGVVCGCVWVCGGCVWGNRKTTPAHEVIPPVPSVTHAHVVFLFLVVFLCFFLFAHAWCVSLLFVLAAPCQRGVRKRGRWEGARGCAEVRLSRRSARRGRVAKRRRHMKLFLFLAVILVAAAYCGSL